MRRLPSLFVTCGICKREFDARLHPSQKYCDNICRYAGAALRGREARPLSPTDAAYLAGILDGEGTISLHHDKDRPLPTPLISIANTSKDLLVWVANATGLGSIQPHRRYASTLGPKPQFNWSTTSKGAAGVIAQVRPYLLIKSAQADILLAVAERRATREGVLDPSWGDDAVRAIRELNGATSWLRPIN